jgi:CDP-6-deoxy-D-xylo-4-hexulose-3-dehydrase
VDRFDNDRRFRIQREHGDSSWFGFSLVIVDPSMSRSSVITHLAEKDIECRPIVAGNILRNPVIRHFDYSVYDECKAANETHDQGFFVGNSHEDIRPQIDYLSDVLSRI